MIPTPLRATFAPSSIHLTFSPLVDGPAVPLILLLSLVSLCQLGLTFLDRHNI